MILDAKSKYSNELFSDLLDGCHYELEVDAIMWNSWKKLGVNSYDFTGENLVEYFRLLLDKLLSNHGVMVISEKPGQKFHRPFDANAPITEQVEYAVNRWGRDLEDIKEEVWIVHEDKVDWWLHPEINS